MCSIPRGATLWQLPPDCLPACLPWVKCASLRAFNLQSVRVCALFVYRPRANIIEVINNELCCESWARQNVCLVNFFALFFSLLLRFTLLHNYDVPCRQPGECWLAWQGSLGHFLVALWTQLIMSKPRQAPLPFPHLSRLPPAAPKIYYDGISFCRALAAVQASGGTGYGPGRTSN